MIVGFCFLAILTSIVVLSEIRERNRQIEKLKKDWKFCKSLLDDAREILTEEQKERLYRKRVNCHSCEGRNLDAISSDIILK